MTTPHAAYTLSPLIVATGPVHTIVVEGDYETVEQGGDVADLVLLVDARPVYTGMWSKELILAIAHAYPSDPHGPQ